MTTTITIDVNFAGVTGVYGSGPYKDLWIAQNPTFTSESGYVDDEGNIDLPEDLDGEVDIAFTLSAGGFDINGKAYYPHFPRVPAQSNSTFLLAPQPQGSDTQPGLNTSPPMKGKPGEYGKFNATPGDSTHATLVVGERDGTRYKYCLVIPFEDAKQKRGGKIVIDPLLKNGRLDF